MATERDKHGVTLLDTFSGTERSLEDIRISGCATMGLSRPDGGYFSCPVISHVTGNLWQGGFLPGLKLPNEFRYVISLYPWGQWELPESCTRTEITMYDDAGGLDGEQIDDIAALVNECCEEGLTLVHCQAGLNRSGLVAARALILRGYEPQDAIDLLRKSRCDMVLCNQSFEEWLLGAS